jgi:hypothetical protein
MKYINLHFKPGGVNTDLFYNYIENNPIKKTINYLIYPLKWYVMKDKI